MFSLPERAAEARNRQVVIAFNEFQAMWQRLTLSQRAVLRAAVLEDGRELLSPDSRTRHGLGGASTVQASLRALVREETLAREGPRYVVVDALLRE